jgi:two-component sensor histidine kinase
LSSALAPDAVALLAALPEPAVIVAGTGTLAHHNRSAAQAFGHPMEGRSLGEWAEDDAAAVESYLARCLGTSSPLLGALTLRTTAGAQRFQARGARIGLASGPAILLRLTRDDEARFQALTRKVEELNTEIVQHKRTEAILQETLREREVLLRELQHRVKNNMQMLAGMLLGAAREAGTPEARTALADAASRFSAVSAVQQLLYASDALEAVDSEALVSALVKAASALDTSVELSSRADPIALPTERAVPIALILNELLTNALKYGRPSVGTQRIMTDFAVRGDAVRLEVRDNGPGFAVPQALRRASGIGLVRALLRQLGGRLEVMQAEGGSCVATFAVAEPRSRGGGA